MLQVSMTCGLCGMQAGSIFKGSLQQSNLAHWPKIKIPLYNMALHNSRRSQISQDCSKGLQATQEGFESLCKQMPKLYTVQKLLT